MPKKKAAVRRGETPLVVIETKAAAQGMTATEMRDFVRTCMAYTPPSDNKHELDVRMTLLETMCRRTETALADMACAVWQGRHAGAAREDALAAALRQATADKAKATADALRAREEAKAGLVALMAEESQLREKRAQHVKQMAKLEAWVQIPLAAYAGDVRR